jgi:hypothetical protein
MLQMSLTWNCYLERLKQRKMEWENVSWIHLAQDTNQ